MRFFLIPSLAFLFLFLPRVVLAAPNITISSYPSSVSINQEFTVSVSLSGLDPGVSYLIKSLGGESFYRVETWSEKTGSWLAWNAAWDNMPEITSDSQGSAAAQLKSRFNEQTTLAENLYKIRIRKVGSSTNYDSETVTISVTEAPSPTPTPTPSPTQTPTPKPTTTPKAISSPTPIPKVAGKTTVEPEVSPSPTLQSIEVLEKPELEQSKIQRLFLPGLLIILGLALLVFGAFPFVKEFLARYNEPREGDSREEI